MAIIKYDLTGFYNFRDGGGLPAGAGRLRTQRLLRSDQPSSLDSQDVDYLWDLPLAMVVDLRGEMEVELAPSPFKHNGFQVDHHPIGAGSPASMLEGKMTIDLMYTQMLKHGGKAFAGAVQSVARGLRRGSVIVHCTAGKDRTGITIAMIQQMLGVPRDAIVDSYALTKDNLDGAWKDEKVAMVEKMIGAKNAQAMVPLMVDSPPESMNKVLDHLDAEYGGAAGYLRSHGMDPSVEDALRNQLVIQ